MESKFDLALVGGRILTMDADLTEYSDGLILVKGGRIGFIGERRNGPADYMAAKTIQAGGKIVFPAFFNAHTHLSISLYRGLGGDLRLHDWLERVIWPLESQFCNPDNVYLGSCLSLLEMIKSGTGTLADMNFFSGYAAKAIEESGLRGFIGEALFSSPTPGIADPQDGFSVTEGLIEKFRNHPMLRVYLVLDSPFTCSDDSYRQEALFGQEYGVKICSHVAETRQEFDQFLNLKGMTPVAWLYETGVLSEDFIAIHGVHLTEKDKQLLSDNKVSVIHSPHSNMMLGSGICEVPDLLRRGIRVGLGTDSAASNNGLSMLNELQTTAKLHKMDLLDPSALPARDALRMATTANAGIFGIGSETGMLAEGYSADLMVIDTSTPNMVPMYDPYAQMVYSMENENILTSVVAGKVLMEDRKILTMDEELILKEVVKWSKNASVFYFINIENE